MAVRRSDRPIIIDTSQMMEVSKDMRTVINKFPQYIDYAMNRAVKEVRSKMKAHPYPPELPDQVYERTGNLANRWGTRKIGGKSWGIGNSAWYAQAVIGNEIGRGQIAIHRGRWWLARDIVLMYMEEQLDDISEIILDSVAGQLGAS